MLIRKKLAVKEKIKNVEIEEDENEESDTIEIDESLETKGIILLESNSINTPLLCKKILLDVADIREVKKVSIYINSVGGDLSSFMSLHDTILILRKKFRKQIVTIANGIAASGAALVLQAGSTRLATKNSYVMIHELSSTLPESNTSSMVTELEIMKKFQKTAFKIWADKMGITVKELQVLISGKDYYLNANEAKKQGLIDNVISI
jgi:ATP-dependent Clp endopeptidase proteolytic subunit ClpP